MSQVDQQLAAMDTATQSAPHQNAGAIFWPEAVRPVEAESVAKDPATVMSKLHKQARRSLPRVHDTATDIEHNRTKSNKTDQVEHLRQPKPARNTRKNLKTPESIQATIPSKTLGIHILQPAEKTIRLKPENRPSSRRTPSFFFFSGQTHKSRCDILRGRR